MPDIPAPARHTAPAKSPLTGGVGETCGEGPFGIALKGSGVDSLIFHGTAGRPKTVIIEGDRARFEDAGDLWGRPVGEMVGRPESDRTPNSGRPRWPHGRGAGVVPLAHKGHAAVYGENRAGDLGRAG